MLTTDYVPGAPDWLDLGTPDSDTAAAFYTGLFGWTSESAGPEAGGYGFFTKDRKTVEARGPLHEESARPAWTPYFHTTDVASTAAPVAEARGTVRTERSTSSTRGGWPIHRPRRRPVRRLAARQDPGPRGGHRRGHIVLGGAAHPRPGRQSRLLPHGLRLDRRGDAVLRRDLHRALHGRRGCEGSFGGMAPLQEGHDVTQWLPYFEVSDFCLIVDRAEKLGASELMPAEDGRRPRRHGLGGRPVRRAFRRHHERQPGDARLSLAGLSRIAALIHRWAEPCPPSGLRRDLRQAVDDAVHRVAARRVGEVGEHLQGEAASAAGGSGRAGCASFMTFGLPISFTKARPSV